LNSPEGVFVVDETGFPKQGKQSVGVARQYCGPLGKVANCQVAAFLAYVSPRGHALVDGELFLPQQWIDDPARCRKAGVPEKRAYQTVLQLALAQLRRVQQEGQLQGQWVTADEHYGEGQDFRDALDTEGWLYVLEVQRTTKVFAQASRAEIPARRGRGRRPTRLRLVEGEPGPQTVEEIAAALTASDWQVLTVAEGSQGPRSYQFAARRVWERRDEVPDRECWLVLRRNRDGSESKYYLSNAPRETPLLCLAQVGARRWPVETEFQTAKGETGLDEYEVRSWQGWHHHMVLALLAGAFLLTLQQDWGEKDAPRDPASDYTGATGSTPSAGVGARSITRLACHYPATSGSGQARPRQETPYRVC
jgi:SRSO17 transposase